MWILASAQGVGCPGHPPAATLLSDHGGPRFLNLRQGARDQAQKSTSPALPGFIGIYGHPPLAPVTVERAANQPPRGYEGRSESRSTCRGEQRGPLPRPTRRCGIMPLPASGGRAKLPRGLAPRGYNAKAAWTSRPDRLRFSLLGRALCQHVYMPRIRCEDGSSLVGYPPQLGPHCFSPSERWSFGVVRLGAMVILTGAEA